MLRSVGSGARYRTISVPSDDEDAEGFSILVVYCRHCGTTLDMVKVEDSS